MPSSTLLQFATSLAESARLMTAEQVARHPDLSWRTQPIRRASAFLTSHPELFERLPGPVGFPHRWRLAKSARHQKPVSGWSMKAEHWIGLGDVWCALTFAGGKPQDWVTEWDGQFDVYCEWGTVPFLIEYQRTPISKRVWQSKWKHRLEWYKAQPWQRKPIVVLVDVTGQQDDTICLPKGTVHVKSIEHLAHKLRRAMKPTP